MRYNSWERFENKAGSKFQNKSDRVWDTKKNEEALCEGLSKESLLAIGENYFTNPSGTKFYLSWKID